MENQKNGNIGAWYPKTDGRDFILNYDPERQVPDGYTMIQPLHGVEYQRFDDGTQSWVADPGAEEKAKAIAEREQILAEVAARDYRALKAVKLGKGIDDLYPGEAEWYRERMARAAELGAVIEGA